jgi:hypothetical protein
MRGRLVAPRARVGDRDRERQRMSGQNKKKDTQQPPFGIPNDEFVSG